MNESDHHGKIHLYNSIYCACTRIKIHQPGYFVSVQFPTFYSIIKILSKDVFSPSNSGQTFLQQVMPPSLVN